MLMVELHIVCNLTCIILCVSLLCVRLCMLSRGGWCWERERDKVKKVEGSL